MPRLSGVFRYSGIGGEKGPYISSGYGTWDRSFDLRIDLLEENKFIPNITVGLQDIIGTGYYSAEYFVASKKIFKNLRTSAGLGWGRLASRNIIKKGNRGSRNVQSTGGTLNYNNLFTGSIGLFGGIEYKSHIEGLKLKAELSSDDYKREAYLLSNVPKKNVNLSADYILNDSVSFSIYHVNSQSTGIQLNLSASPLQISGGDYLDQMPEPFYSLPFPDLNKKEISSKLKNDLDELGIELLAINIDQDEAKVIITNSKFPSHTKAIGRSLRLMSKYIPSQVKKFIVVLATNDIPITETSINRDKLSEIIDAPNAELLTKRIKNIETAPTIIPISDEDYKIKQTDNFSWNFSPYQRLHLFDPNKPLYYDIGIEGQLAFKIKDGTKISLTSETSVFSTFDEIWRGTKGKLPHVRTDLKNYLNVQETRIKDLILSSYYKLSSDIYGRTTIGYLEPMYAGISSELLRFSSKSNFAFGTEINYVRPRSFRQLFGLRKIDKMANLNGHFSSYWDTNYYNYLAQVDVGKYLANDNGASFKLTRHFPNGWKIGGFFSITDASFEDFGEGSFDKGFFLRIPYHSLSPYETRSAYSERVRPLQGDGGQKVNVPGRLYDDLIDMSSTSLSNTWPNVWR